MSIELNTHCGFTEQVLFSMGAWKIQRANIRF